MAALVRPTNKSLREDAMRSLLLRALVSLFIIAAGVDASVAQMAAFGTLNLQEIIMT
jgi:hypothetical protein